MAVIKKPITIVKTGGGEDDGGYKVRFIDYDGTILQTLSLAEAASLSALPTPPTHSGLQFVEWTETLATINATMAPLDVGATYISDLTPEGGVAPTVLEYYPAADGESVTLNFYQDTADGVTVDWGDGSTTETNANTGSVALTHTYTTVSYLDMPYKIILTPNSGVIFRLGVGSATTPVINGTLGRVILGDCGIMGGAFYSAQFSSIVTSRRVTAISGGAFNNSPLNTIIYPPGLTTVGYEAFLGANRLSLIILPTGITSFSTNTFKNTASLKRVIVPSTLTNAGRGTTTFVGSGLEQLITPVFFLPATIPTATIRSFIFTKNLSSSGQINTATPFLESIEYTGTVLSFQSYFLAANNSITNFIVPSGTTTINNGSIVGRILKHVFIPSTVTTVFDNAISSNSNVMVVEWEDRASMTAVYPLNSASKQLFIHDFTGFTAVPTVTSGFLGAAKKNTTFVVPDALYTSWTTDADWSTVADQIIKESDWVR